MRVLVVEDETTLAAALARGLRAEGFDVDIAADGPTGLWQARECAYGVIVLDLLLPGLNGYRICSQLRAEGNWTPILMLTAKTGEYDEAEALDSGADDFLSKPFSFVVLVARLHALARRGSGPRPAVLSSGALRLDPAARSCTQGTDEIALTPRQFALLEALMRRAGDTVTKAELLETVWGMDACDPNIVEVYVSYLRRKLGPAAIETIRGLGYRMVRDG